MEDIEIVAFGPGDYLFHENEKSFQFYIVQEGQVEIFKMSANGAKIPLALVGAGNSLGEFAMIDRNPRSASARALTEVRCARISEEAYQHLLQELPDWAIAVMKALVERLRHMNEVVRQAHIVDEKTLMDIEAIQFDDTSTIREETPDLRPPTDNPEDN